MHKFKKVKLDTQYVTNILQRSIKITSAYAVGMHNYHELQDNSCRK